MTELDESRRRTLLHRLSTHVPGLDTVMRGGAFCGGIYMVAGEPGAGKTLLANQMCYGHVKAGGRALYLTLLSETHARMLAALQEMSFFDPQTLGDAMQYIGGYAILESDRLDGLLKLLRRELRVHKTTLLVLDGLTTAHSFVDSDLEMKRFIHELQVLLEMLGCTALVLTGSTSGLTQYSQRTMVDGLLLLSAKRIGIRVVRELEVSKHRGSRQIMGGNFFEITSDGLTVHPRFEDLTPTEPPKMLSAQLPRTSLGLAHLDALLVGGVIKGSTTLLTGPAGFEKLLFGLTFLMHGVRGHEPTLYLTSSEMPRLHTTLAHAAAMGLNDAVDKQQVSVMYMSAQGQTIDSIVALLLKRIDALEIKRLFINGVAVLRAAMIYPERSYDIFAALGRALQQRGVTTIMTEDDNLAPTSIEEMPHVGDDISGFIDYLIGLRFVTRNGRRRGLLTVLTAPNKVDDLPVREFFVTGNGVEVAPDAQSAQEILAGSKNARQSGSGLG